MTPQTKGIKDLHELKDFIQTDKQKKYSITSFFKHFCTKQVDNLFVRFKTKGISFNEAILKLLLMTIGQMTIFHCVSQEGDNAIAGKDAFYSIKNNPWTDWRVIVMTMAMRFQSLKCSRGAVMLPILLKEPLERMIKALYQKIWGMVSL